MFIRDNRLFTLFVYKLCSMDKTKQSFKEVSNCAATLVTALGILARYILTRSLLYNSLVQTAFFLACCCTTVHRVSNAFTILVTTSCKNSLLSSLYTADLN